MKQQRKIKQVWLIEVMPDNHKFFRFQASNF